MFVIAPDYRYPWPIVVRRPSLTQPGTYEVAGSFTVMFRGIPQDEAIRLDAEAAAVPADAPPEEQDRWRYYAAKAATVGWSGLSFDGVKEAEFTAENMARVFGDPHVAMAIWRGWLASRTEAVAGN